MRESHAAELMELHEGKGVLVEYTDPHVPVSPKMREHYFDLESVEPTPEKIAAYDLLLLATAHKAFDYEMFKKNAQLIVDTRGVYLEPANNIVKS